MSRRPRLGLVVNPIAGIGGTVALKGSDGPGTVEQALRLGAKPVAPQRALEMLKTLSVSFPNLELLVYPGEMGEEEATAAGFTPTVLGLITPGKTTAADTVRAASELKNAKIDLLMFVGGDGTARDIFDAINGDIPVVGIPAGVKLHSSVFAVNPRRAAEIVVAYLAGKTATRELEVMDIDEDLARRGRLSAQLYGHLCVPDQPQLLQGSKAGSRIGGEDAPQIAARIIAEMDEDTYYILGPGTTTRAITDQLGIEKTLLGVDVVHRRQLSARDATESELYTISSHHPCVIVIAVIGGQGYVLGRGNQQVSSKVIRAVGIDNLVIIGTRDKLLALNGPLRVDTGDTDCDSSLSGYRRVITGRHEESIWMVEA